MGKSRPGDTHLVLEQVIHRNFVVMMYRIVALMALFTFSSLLTFFIPADDGLADRLAYAVTLMLTATAYSLVVADILPTLGYLTWLDQYILLTLVFMFIVMAQVTVIQRFELSEDAEGYIVLIDFCIWLLAHLALVATIRYYILPKEMDRSDVKRRSFAVG